MFKERDINEGTTYRGEMWVGLKEPTVMAKYSESHCHPLEKRGREGAVQWQLEE